ncbi:MAG: hypothetical protein AAF570_11000, partial [Bacteroidota bacterium]
DPNHPSSTKKHYLYKNIVVVGIDTAGNIDFSALIPKHQYTINDLAIFSSYVRISTKDGIHFIYNDSRDNLVDLSKGWVRHFSIKDRKGVAVIASIDNEGHLERKILVENDEIPTIVVPKSCHPISEDKLLLFGKRGKKAQFGMVSF